MGDHPKVERSSMSRRKTPDIEGCLTRLVNCISLDEFFDLELDQVKWDFFGDEYPYYAVGEEEYDLAWKRLMDWFVFEYLIEEIQKTPLEAFLEEYQSKLSPEELKMYHSFRRNIYGLFRVEKVVPGKEIEGINLLDGCYYTLRDKKESRYLQEGMVFVARILPVKGYWQLLGNLHPLPDEAVEVLEKRYPLSASAPYPRVGPLEVERIFSSLVTDEDLKDLEIVEQRLSIILQKCAPESLTLEDIRKRIRESSYPSEAFDDLYESMEFDYEEELDELQNLLFALWNYYCIPVFWEEDSWFAREERGPKEPQEESTSKGLELIKDERVGKEKKEIAKVIYLEERRKRQRSPGG